MFICNRPKRQNLFCIMEFWSITWPILVLISKQNKLLARMDQCRMRGIYKRKVNFGCIFDTRYGDTPKKQSLEFLFYILEIWSITWSSFVLIRNKGMIELVQVRAGAKLNFSSAYVSWIDQEIWKRRAPNTWLSTGYFPSRLC